MIGWFRDLKIKAKVTVNNLILCLVILGVSVIGLNGLQTMGSCMTYLYYDSMAGISNIKEIKANIQYMRLIMQGIILPQYRLNLPAQEKELNEIGQSLNQSMKNYEEAITTPEDLAMFRELQKWFASYRDGRYVILKLVKNNEYTLAEEVYQREVVPINLAIIEQLDKLNAWNDNVGKIYIKDAEKSYNEAVKTMISLGVLGLLMAMILGYFVVRNNEE